MKILHTSDWHIGKSLYGKKRYQEFQQFVLWLKSTIEEEQIDALIIAGDIFDTSTPSPQALQAYFDFLKTFVHSNCRHIVIIGGNHDSPAILNAPKDILSLLNIHIVGCAGDELDEQIIVLQDNFKRPEFIVCAAPFLRDKDLRTPQAGESIECKERTLFEGISKHYSLLAELALAKRAQFGAQIPIIATGHLFAAGCHSQPDDGVRQLYVGTLGHVPAELFSEAFDYVALGHLHTAQELKGKTLIRYSGSPLPMTFSEDQQAKSVTIVDFDKNQQKPQVTTIAVPLFQELKRIEGDWQQIELQVNALLQNKKSVWTEITYSGEALMPDLMERLEQLIAYTPIEILKVRNLRTQLKQNNSFKTGETLDDLSERDIFERCLESNEIKESEKDDLRQRYSEILQKLFSLGSNSQNEQNQ